jgi:hypothetical protein
MWEAVDPRARYAVLVLCGCAHCSHDVAIECGWHACVGRSAQASTREPADAHLQGDAWCDVTIVDPT